MNRIYIVAISTSILALLTTSIAQAEISGKEIALKGNSKGAVACSSCHGVKGQGNAAAAYPYLAGLPADYIKHQLESFSSGERPNPIMQPFSKALSATEKQAVADFYANLPLPAKAMEETPMKKDQLALGESLMKSGKWQAGVPACVQCHGDRGQGLPPHFPAISGQPSQYLKMQLEHWKKGERKNDPIGLMQAVVAELTDKEITAVSSYLATLAPATDK